jgi:serine/threonine protein kinase
VAAGSLIAGRYRLDEPLGAGGTASVWTAYDLELERPVAVKILAHGADRQRFEREARAAALLTHPNVCRLYDFGDSSHGLFMVLELLTGGTLEDRLRRGRPLPDAETARIAAEVAAGLADAHAHGLVHRDLKPANILFDAEGRARIADFGIARMGGAGTLTEAGTVLGTAAYISPEQAFGHVATPASDVYSFGVVLYRMVTGHLPFEADEPLALVAAHAHELPPPIEDLRRDAPPRLAAVAATALHKDPSARPPDGAALLAELGATGPLPATSEATAVLVPRRARRRREPRTPVLAAGVLLLAAAGGAAALLATRGTDTQPPAKTQPATSPGGDRDQTEPPPAPTTTTVTTTTQEATTESQPTETAPTEPEPTLPTLPTLPTVPTDIPPS